MWPTTGRRLGFQCGNYVQSSWLTFLEGVSPLQGARNAGQRKTKHNVIVGRDRISNQTTLAWFRDVNRLPSCDVLGGGLSQAT